MILASLIAFFTVLMTVPVSALERPLTPQEWQKMYDACLEGGRAVAQQLNLPPEYAPTFCTCARDNLKTLAPAEWDTRFPVIRERCTNLARNLTQPPPAGWPSDGFSRLRSECYQKPPSDVPAQALNAFCTCYVDYVPKNVSFREWLLVGLAINTKGLQNLDAQEKSILTKVLSVRAYCTAKFVSQ
jgi:hypothetical protein